MGWVVEQAGGKASTGAGAMLDQKVRPVVLNISKSTLPRCKVRERLAFVSTVGLEELASEKKVSVPCTTVLWHVNIAGVFCSGS